jgi:hypothetical protein
MSIINENSIKIKKSNIFTLKIFLSKNVYINLQMNYTAEFLKLKIIDETEKL